MISSRTHVGDVCCSDCGGKYGLVEKSHHFEDLGLKYQLRLRGDKFWLRSHSFD